MKEIMTGGVGEVAVGEGLVSMTLVRKEIRPTDEPEVVHELFLPPNGFLHLYSQLENLVGKMMEDGMLRRETEGEGDA